MLDAAAVVLSSPLSRCLRTAEVIAARLGSKPVTVEPDLIECDFGEWDGLTFAEVRERWPDLLDRWLASPAVAAPGGESIDAVAARVSGVVPRLLDTHPAETVILVSHVTPIKVILRDALGAGDTLLYRLFLDPAGFSIVDWWPDGGVAVRTVNDTSHLTER
jgi:probable phosphoglycerate mutase